MDSQNDSTVGQTKFCNVALPKLYWPMLQRIEEMLCSGQQILLGIDGMSGAGKSNLSAVLQKRYRCGVVKADDFFLQSFQRTPDRLAEPGGNIDYERLAPVVQDLAKGEGLRYRKFNCQTGLLAEEVYVCPSKLAILEGVYSLHANIGAQCNIRVFLEVDKGTQYKRILKRSGAELAKRYIEEWIPMEQNYFDTFGIKQSCDYVFDTSRL